MSDKIRYGVIGLGHIAQVAVLPAFENAKKNSTTNTELDEALNRQRLPLIVIKLSIPVRHV